MWERLAAEFEQLARAGDANLTWNFDASLQGVREHWSFADAPSEQMQRTLRDLLAEAGARLSAEGGRRMFSVTLLAEPSPERLWFVALRHARINVLRFEPEGLRLDRGMIFDVAAASTILCWRLAKRSSPGPFRSRGRLLV